MTAGKSLGPRLLRLLLIGMMFFALAWLSITMTRGPGRLAAVWLPNAFLTALTLRSKRYFALDDLLAGLAGNVAANIAIGNPANVTLWLPLANSVEIALAVLLMRRSGAGTDISNLPTLGRFMAFGGVLAPAVSALVPAFVLAGDSIMFEPGLWLAWLMTHGLGQLIGVPFALAVADAWNGPRRSRRRPPLRDWTAWTAGALAILSIVFFQQDYPFLFLALPVAIAFGFRFGVAGAAFAMVLLTIIGSVATSLGNGPINLVHADFHTRLIVLQAFLAASLLTSMPMAAALEGRERDRAALTRHQEMSRSMLENMREVVFRTDPEGRWIFLNPAWEALTGYGVADSLGRPTTALLHPDDLAIAHAIYPRIVSGEVGESLLKQRFTTASGEVRHIEVSVRALRSADGRFDGTIGNIRDVTDQVVVLDQLAEREVQLALLASNATDAVFRIALDGTCLYASPSTRDLLGADPRHFVGRNLLTRFHPDDEGKVLETFQRLIAGDTERFVVTYRSQPLDGRAPWIWMEANCGAVRSPDSSKPVEIIASIRDVSERKELELQLHAALQSAEAAADAKSRFLANMSHEIRTPMNGVIGFTDLLLAGDLTEGQRRHAQLIADSGQAMMALLNDILDLSKVEAGMMQTIEETVAIETLLRDCLRLVEPAAQRKRLALVAAVDESVPPLILSDSLRLRQIVLNLLNNAVKFTSSGRVRLDARLTEGRQLAIAISDTGIGIARDRQDAIFEPFCQAEGGTDRRFGGTGLGLTISAQLARLLGGTLAVDSEPGQGAKFTLTVPLRVAPAEEGTAQVQPVATPSAQGRRLRVLLAEDHDVNQALMMAMLDRLGHDVELAVDGAEAAAKAVAAPEWYDLVLMDMQMPGVDGLQATRMIRAHGLTAEHLPIVALTANAAADDVERCRQAGMQAHVAKPVHLATLGRTIAQWAKAPSEPRGSTVAGPIPNPAAMEARYRRERDETLRILRTCCGTDNIGDADTELLIRRLHKLAGIAALFGEAELGQRAGQAEDDLARAPADRRRELLGEHLTSLKRARGGN